MRAVIDEIKGKYARLLSEHGDHVSLPLESLHKSPQIGDVVRVRAELDAAATESRRKLAEAAVAAG